MKVKVRNRCEDIQKELYDKGRLKVSRPYPKVVIYSMLAGKATQLHTCLPPDDRPESDP